MATSRRDLLLGWRRGVCEDAPPAEEPSPASPPPPAPRPFVGLRDLRPRGPDRDGLAHAAAQGLDAAVAEEVPLPLGSADGGATAPPGSADDGATAPSPASPQKGTAPSPPSDEGP